MKSVMEHNMSSHTDSVTLPILGRKRLLSKSAVSLSGHVALNGRDEVRRCGAHRQQLSRGPSIHGEQDGSGGRRFELTIGLTAPDSSRVATERHLIQLAWCRNGSVKRNKGHACLRARSREVSGGNFRGGELD